MDMPDKLIIGCGYLGKRVAQRWVGLGHRVFVTTRSEQNAEQFRDQHLVPILADVTDPDSLRQLPSVSTILFSVGFDRRTGHSIYDVYVRGVEAVLHATRDRFDKFIYVSSTGVYGDADGEWVDESADCEPTRAGSQACLAAENLLRGSAASSRSIVLRLAGIYGPGRVPNRAALENGQFVPEPSDRYLNLIHVEDAAECCVLADAESKLPNLLNVTDGNPVLKRDYYQAIRELLKLSDVPTTSPEGNGNDRTDHRRVSNRMMLAELSIKLQFENYRIGLGQALRS